MAAAAEREEGEETFRSSYRFITDSKYKDLAIINLPYLENDDFLNKELKEFLINIAPLKNFNENLCNQMLKIDDSRIWIQQLIQQNVFIEPLEDRSGWFCLHPVMVELLSRFHNEKDILEIHFNAFHYLKEQGFDDVSHPERGSTIEF